MTITEGFSIDRYYELLKWPEDPGDPHARNRFQTIRNYFKNILSREFFNEIIGREEVRVLDLMGATGIAGVALLSAINDIVEEKKKFKLTVLDLRRKQLTRARRWIELAKLEGVQLEPIVGDVRRIPKTVEGEFDIALIWGSSLPHLNVRDLILLLAGVREVSASDGVIIIEQHDSLPRQLFSNNYMRVLLEGEALTIHKGYDPLSGWIERIVYDARTMLYQGIIRIRLWEIATVIGYLWIFYQDVLLDRIIEDNKLLRILIGLKPREKTPSWNELWEGQERIRNLQAP